MFKGFYYLYLKEVKRFMKVYGQTLIGPVITSLLFFLVFSVSIGERLGNSSEFINFLIPGLIMMQVTQNAFANSSSSLLMSKIFGTFNDVLMSPLNNFQIAMAYILGAVTRGLFVAISVLIIIYVITNSFVEFRIYNIFYCFYFVIMGSFFLGALGLICGLWSKTFDHLSTITNVIIMPLSFLSGTFYSVNNLPIVFKTIVHFNPVFYIIDGFRYGFTGKLDFNIFYEMLIIFILNIILYFYCVFLLKKGYNTRF